MERLKSLWRKTRQWTRQKVRRPIQKWATPIRCVGLVVLALGVIGAWISYPAIHPDGFRLADFLSDFYANASTELVSIALTVLVLDTLSENRAKKERKRAIIQQMGSRVNNIALEATRIARLEGWLDDGSLRGVCLMLADLQRADLRRADLQRADLRWTNMQEANLWEARLPAANLWEAKLPETKLRKADLQETDLRWANMQKANLQEANLRRAHLQRINLQGADLRNANLQGADLRAANLQMVYMQGAYLQEANLDEARLDELAILPDGTNWTPDTGLSRFTDPKHPNFWRSDDPTSPACRGYETPPEKPATPKPKIRRRRKKAE